MSQANVDDLDIFRYVKVGLVKFRQSVETALINADGQGARTLHWLEGEQISYWQTQIRKRQELIMRIREAIRAKKLFKDSSGRTPSAFQEEKQLQAALKALEEAELKLANTKRHIPMLQKELEAYRGGVQGLGSAMVTELPKAIAMLERLSASLQEYISLASQTPSSPDTPTLTTAPAGNMHRGGESAPEAQPPAGAKPQDPKAGGNDVTG